MQRCAGEILVVHEAAHERHDVRGGGEAFSPEGAGLGGLDEEELSVQLFGHVLADLLVAELGGVQGTDAALEVAGVHLVGAAEVLNVEFGVVDLLLAMAQTREPMCER